MRSFSGLFLLGCVSASAVWGQGADVLPGQRRADTIALAARLEKPAPVAELPTGFINPFAPDLGRAVPADPTAAEPAGPGSPREVLEAVAPHINPAGSFRVNDRPLLLIGGKRLQVGDSLPITYEGHPYVLQLSAIDNHTFTLRLQGEEITRSIKPANRP